MDPMSITATSLLNDIDRLGTLSHNLANATTPGFRRDVAVSRGFDARLSSELDRTQGAMRYSANALDVALESDGFLVLQSAAGPVLTRHGALHLDPSGRLVGPNGGAVLGTSGEIVLSQPEPHIESDKPTSPAAALVYQLGMTRGRQNRQHNDRQQALHGIPLFGLPFELKMAFLYRVGNG